MPGSSPEKPHSRKFTPRTGTDYIWEFLDVMETYLAEELDGVIYTSEEGFFDADNKPIRAFS